VISKSDLYRYIGERIKAKRLASSLKQEDLADLVGLTRSSIAQIEAGRQAPSVYLLYQLGNALKTTLFELLPVDEFDPLSSGRVVEKDEIVDILNKVKGDDEYEPPEYNGNR
jgi:transcriptional regulator with XRE-family HTH domain